MPTGNLVDSTTRRVEESFFFYEYLHEFEAKIGKARKVAQGIYEDPVSAKTPENPPRCHVPLNLMKKINHNPWGWEIPTRCEMWIFKNIFSMLSIFPLYIDLYCTCQSVICLSGTHTGGTRASNSVKSTPCHHNRRRPKKKRNLKTS